MQCGNVEERQGYGTSGRIHEVQYTYYVLEMTMMVESIGKKCCHLRKHKLRNKFWESGEITESQRKYYFLRRRLRNGVWGRKTRNQHAEMPPSPCHSQQPNTPFTTIFATFPNRS